MEETVDGNVLAAMSLAKFSVQHMFGMVGIPMTSLATRAVSFGIRFLAFHNEQSAGYAASAYGYLTACPGVLLIVSGPSCVHGLSNAAANAWPLFMISGSSDQSYAGRGDFQELDQIEAVKPFSKFSVQATNITEIPNSVTKALSWALLGRPGECYLDLPTDVLHQKLPLKEAQNLLIEAEKFFSSSNQVKLNQIQISELVA